MKRRDIKRKRISIPIHIKEVDIGKYIDISRYEMCGIIIDGYTNDDGNDVKRPFADSIYSSDDAVVSGASVVILDIFTRRNRYNIFGKPSTQCIFNINVWWYKGLITIESTRLPVNIKNLNIVVYYKKRREE